jgi:hypothetical protein
LLFWVIYNGDGKDRSGRLADVVLIFATIKVFVITTMDVDRLGLWKNVSY